MKDIDINVRNETQNVHCLLLGHEWLNRANKSESEAVSETLCQQYLEQLGITFIYDTTDPKREDFRYHKGDAFLRQL